MTKDSTQSFTVTSAAIPGVLSAIGSGVASGFAQSFTNSNKAVAVLSENNDQRASLLRALKALFEEPAPMDHSALETYLKELKMGLIATNDSLAVVIRNILLSAFSGAGHLSQVPLDLATAVNQVTQGLANLEIPTDKTQGALPKAFTFDANRKDASISGGVVVEMFDKFAKNVSNNIQQGIHVPDNSHADTHARSANSTAAVSITATAALPMATAGLIDTLGQVFREGSAIQHLSSRESQSNAEKNVYHASSEIAKATQQSDSHASERELRALDIALSETKPAAQLMCDQSVTTPLTTALLRLVVLSLFVESSQGLSKTAIVITDERLQKALALATAQGPSGGVDRIKSLHSNLSSLSNIMRLCAENLGGAPAIKTAVQSSEVVSSRSISVLLSHVSELAKALHQLVVPNPGENSLSMASRASIELAKPEVLAQSEAIIKAVLDRIEAENQQNVIPGLNQDLASQLNTSAYTGIASLLTFHSLFSNPVSLAVKGSKEASKVNDAQKNEALLETLPSLTQMLNSIQATTRNFIEAMEKEMHSASSKNEGSLLSTHKNVASSTAAIYWSLSTIALLCDEMLTICRSVTLIDQKRLQEASQKASEVQSKDESAQASEQIAWDSHLGENHSATHAITALRLTLSHTGIALMRIALALDHAVKGKMHTVQQDIAMHTLQKSLLASSAYAARYLVEGLLFSAGALSASPASLKGSANSTHKVIHSTDANLNLDQTHLSEESCKSTSESFQTIGFATDLVANTVSNILKVIAQGGIIGLDTILKLIKVLEIVSLHRDSHIALQLESNDASLPNGVFKNTLIEPCVGSSAGTGAVLMNLLAAFQNLDKSCGTHSTLNAQDRLKDVIDQYIEELAILKDDEENNEKIGLKGFYKIIIRLLSPGDASHYDDLIRRLDFGGIALSSYHSGFGAYSNRPSPDLRFIKQFANDDDAQGLLLKFVDKTKSDFTLLKSLHNALPEGVRSKKVQSLYEHIFEAAYQHYKQMKMKDVAEHSSSRRKVPTRETFKDDLGLELIELRVDEDSPTETNTISLR